MKKYMYIIIAVVFIAIGLILLFLSLGRKIEERGIIDDAGNFRRVAPDGSVQPKVLP